MNNRSLWAICLLLVAAALAFQYIEHRKFTERTSRELSSSPGPMFSPHRFIAPHAGENRIPIYAGCAEAKVGTIKFTGKVVTHHLLAKLFSFEKNPQSAVELQLRYLQGWLHHGDPTGNAKKTLGLLRTRKIKILKKSWEHYGRSLDVDPQNGDDTSIYPKQFSETHHISANDRALHITYEVEQQVYGCGTEQKEAVKIALPFDPQLAFWLVPADRRKEIRFGPHRAVTNPCSYSQMADLKRPSLYWYVWNPIAQSPANPTAEKQNQFNCRELLTAGVDYQWLDADFVGSARATEPEWFSQLAAQPSLDVRMIFGLISPTTTRKTLDDALLWLRGESGDLRVNANLLMARLKKARAAGEPSFLAQDPAVWSLLEFTNALGQIADLDKPELKDAGTHFLFTLSGRLKFSQKPLHMQIYFGPTDVIQKNAYHWPFLLSSLTESSLVFYVGHSGIGNNLDFKRFAAAVELSLSELEARISQQPYQLFSIISCYSNSYFSEDYFKFRRRPGLVSDLMLTAQGFYAFLAPAAFLYFLDLNFTSQRPSLERALQFGLRSGEVTIIERNGAR